MAFMVVYVTLYWSYSFPWEFRLIWDRTARAQLCPLMAISPALNYLVRVRFLFMSL